MDFTVDPHEVRRYAQRLSERLRLLRAEQLRVPSPTQPFVSSVVSELEESAEELRVTEEELRVQNEELAASAHLIEAERLRVQRLFDLAPGALLTTDAFGRIRLANRVAARLLGVGQDVLRGKPLAVFVTSGTTDFRSYLTDAARLESMDDLRLVVRPRSGADVALNARAVAVGGGRGTDLELVWSFTPAAAQPGSEAARPVAEARREGGARFLARAAARLHASLDLDRVARTAAHLAEGRFAERAAVVLAAGPTDALCVVPSDAGSDEPAGRVGLRDALGPDGEAAIRSVLATGHDLHDVAYAVHPLPSEHSVEAALVLVHPGARAGGGGHDLLLGAFCGAAGAALGNARRFAEQRDQLRRAERAQLDRRRAMVDLSHEFRTPLHSILGYAELLADGVPEPLPEAAREQVRSIAQGARHLAGVIEDVLSLHRLDETHHLDRAEVDVADVLRECAMIVRGRAEAAELALEVDAPAELIVRTDGSKLRQVLINLLGNAIKFTREGTVTLSAAREGREVVVTVRDTGPGIAADDLPHIFEPFWRGDQALSRKVEGAGLGLALVRSLVGALGGTLQLDTAPGRGTTFRIRLPAEPAS